MVRDSILVLAIFSVALSAACREEQIFDGGLDDEGAITIEALQRTNHVEHPDVGSRVFIRSAVVTVYDSYAEPEMDRVQVGDEWACVSDVGYDGGVVVQMVGGGQWSGVSLFAPSLVPANQVLGPGDLVDVRGEYVEFCWNEGPDNDCQAADTERLTQLGNGTVTKVGEAPLPEPAVITTSTVLEASAAEPYEGVLVQINDRLQVRPCTPTDGSGRPNCCVGDYDRYGNLGVGTLDVSNEFYSIPEGTSCVTSITGVLNWFFSYYVSPRGPDDVVIPPECQAD